LTGVCTLSSSIAWRSLGRTSGRSPAEHDHDDGCFDPHGRVDAEQLLAAQIDVQRDREQRHDDQLALGRRSSR
jgi:hypothetical protein